MYVSVSLAGDEFCEWAPRQLERVANVHEMTGPEHIAGGARFRGDGL